MLYCDEKDTELLQPVTPTIKMSSKQNKPCAPSPIHCSAVTTRSSGATNTDRVIRGPRYTESFFNLETAVVRVGGFVITPPTCTTAGSSSYYDILHIACMLYYMFIFYLFIFFIVETLCMYLA